MSPPPSSPSVPDGERFADPAEIDRVLAEGSAKARLVAADVLERFHDRLGLPAPA